MPPSSSYIPSMLRKSARSDPMRARPTKRDKLRDRNKLSTVPKATQGVSHRLPLSTIYLYHQIWRTLLRGDVHPGHRRRPLPAEIVHLISRLADLRVSDSTRTFVHTEEVLVSSGGSFQTKLWFCTSPFPDNAFDQIAAVQLFTTSNDQGWASDPERGSWTWFEWGLFSDAAEATARAQVESETGGWKTSHRNIIAESKAQHLNGSVVAIDDDMWAGIAGGSVIAVRACAMYPGWSNHAHRAEVRFWKWFKPAI